MKPYFYLFAILAMGACSPMGKNDVGRSGLHGPVKSVQYLRYGVEENEKYAKRLFDKNIPTEEERAEYDQYGRVLRERYADEDGWGWCDRVYEYGDYHIKGGDERAANVLLKIHAPGSYIEETRFEYDRHRRMTKSESASEGKQIIYFRDSCVYLFNNEVRWTFAYKYKDGQVKQIIKREATGLISEIRRFKKGQLIEIETSGGVQKNNKTDGMWPDYRDMTERDRFVPCTENVTYLEFDKYRNWTKRIKKDNNYYIVYGREIEYWEE